MNGKTKLALEHAKLRAQQSADSENQSVYVIAHDGTFKIYLGEAWPPGAEVLYIAYPTIYEQLSPRAAIAYNQHQVRFTTIRKVEGDDGEDVELEETSGLWTVDYARKVQAFLNKVL